MRPNRLPTRLRLRNKLTSWFKQSKGRLKTSIAGFQTTF
ncbi:hypothetical protein HMPREF1051_1215 [Neisseria sicca VK64]|uniref:Uncharacterized protein n=1 Tax=Neisseria sicca VK64 TaxID=1095748 RepID=I2NR89_NEISI|nr:hypothetical protein HMPREF1051_1215 [Neisseria sicca VK64]